MLDDAGDHDDLLDDLLDLDDARDLDDLLDYFLGHYADLFEDLFLDEDGYGDLADYLYRDLLAVWDELLDVAVD